MKKKILVFTLFCAAVAVAVVVKIFFFPSIKDDYFAMDARNLQKVPAGLILVRPTHFPFLHGKGILRARAPSGGKDQLWQMGRNVPLRDVMASGYNWDPVRVALPPDAPTNHFDFLMTGSSNQLARFQTIVRHKLGYSAQKESRNADVLALKIANPALPALTLSQPDERQRINFQNEKLYFSATRLGMMTEIFGRFLEEPMVDKTGATNRYSFTVDWNSKTDQGYEDGTMTRENVEKILGSLGLKLEPDTAPLEMLVVKKGD